MLAGDPLDIFDFLGNEDVSSSHNKKTQNGKDNEEMDEKQKEKIKVQAAREIKKIIHSFPDLSFLNNIKLN